MGEQWEGWYCVSIMFITFVALLKNVAGPDILMLGALAMMLAAGTVDIDSGLAGFSNKGLLTVACLFVVAAGISHTGALDYYMGRLLGHPKDAASAQIRLMVPIAFVSAFLNNTPVVAIMIPILQKWAHKIGVHKAQLFIPLSFASILGGTCTLIGTSTNLVVEGMMRDRYPEEEPMGLFALSIYGVPVAMSGMAYILIAAPFLLKGGSRSRKKRDGDGDGDDHTKLDALAVGAVVAPGSPVIDQPVAALRGLNGLYLVSVQRGDMLLRAVTPEFLLEEGDVLHFTGLVESIGDVCVEFGLLPLTHEVEDTWMVDGGGGGGKKGSRDGDGVGVDHESVRLSSVEPLKSTDTYPPRNSKHTTSRAMAHSRDYETMLQQTFQFEDRAGDASASDAGACSSDGGGNFSSDGGGLSDSGGKHRARRRSADKVRRARRRSEDGRGGARGFANPDDAAGGVERSSFKKGPVRRAMTADAPTPSDAKVGVGAEESAMPIQAVLAAKDTPLGVRKALLERHQVLKCRVRTTSSLIGQTAFDVGFREKYKAAIIAVQRGGEDMRAANQGRLAGLKFEAGDILMLHCLDKCPLLQFKEPALNVTPSMLALQRDQSREVLNGGSDSARSSIDYGARPDAGGATVVDIGSGGGGGGRGALAAPVASVPRDSPKSNEAAAAALLTKFSGGGGGGDDDDAKPAEPRPSTPKSMTPTPSPLGSPSKTKSGGRRSKLALRSSEGSMTSLDGGGGASRSHTPGLGPTSDPDLQVLSREGNADLRAMTDFTCPVRVLPEGALDGKTLMNAGLRGLAGLFLTAVQVAGSESEAMAVPGPEYVLQGGDVLWFAGDANGVHQLFRIPGLVPQTKQVDKLNINKTDRRLVQAVIAVRSPLCGQTVRDSHFRTCYDAVIIAVQRSGGRIQAKIGDIVLSAGDVLLLDTGGSFLRLYKHDPAFALVSEVENSSPPQFEKLLPACLTAVVMIVVFVAGLLDLFVAALLASGVMLATGCLTQKQAREAVKWDIIVTIAAAFGISAAMEQSGVASAIADTLVDGGNAAGTGNAGILVAIYAATVFMCNVVGNNAAAALMYPIAAGAADQQGIDRDQMSFLLMLAASASFMSPFGYQTNLMVYGPGGYVFADFLRFGSPMQVVQMVVSVTVVLLGGLWWTAWVGGFGMILLIYGGRSVAAALEAALCGGDASKEKDEGEEDYGDGALKSVPESEASAGPLAGVV